MTGGGSKIENKSSFLLNSVIITTGKCSLSFLNRRDRTFVFLVTVSAFLSGYNKGSFIAQHDGKVNMSDYLT